MHKPMIVLLSVWVGVSGVCGIVLAQEQLSAGPAAERLMTPRERVERNLRKEALRGRWDRDERIPSEAKVGYARDVVRQVLERIQTDPATTDLIARVQVVSKGRTVTLSGWVQKPEDAQVFVETVRSVDGVDEVVDRLKVATSAQDLVG